MILFIIHFEDYTLTINPHHAYGEDNYYYFLWCYLYGVNELYNH